MSARRKATSHASHSDGCARESESALLARRIEEICLDAVGSVSPAKVEGMAQQWLSKRNSRSQRALQRPSGHGGFRARGLFGAVHAPAVGRRADRTLYSPAPRRRRWSARRSTRWRRQAFIYIQLEARAAPRTFLAKDLANGERLSLFDEEIPDSARGARIATWLAPLPDGGFVALGPLTPLDAGALAEGLCICAAGQGNEQSAALRRRRLSACHAPWRSAH